MYKAKFIGETRDRNPREAWKHTELWYEYRGHQYCVVKHNNDCCLYKVVYGQRI